ncbi:MAG: aspartate 1-decarboxylase [Lentisphaeria bacterium]|jgi:aspartate 1-decarboxylase
MHLQLLKGKIHRARLTGCDLHYEGSLAIDREILARAGILPFEKILVVNATNGERLETYAIPAPRGSRTFLLNGAAAHKGRPGDVVTIMAFAAVTPEEAAGFGHTTLVLDAENRIVNTVVKTLQDYE